MNIESLKRLRDAELLAEQVRLQTQMQNMSYQNGLPNQYSYQPGLLQQMLSQSMLMTPVNPPVKESPKMTNQTLQHLKQVAKDTTASTAAQEAAKLLVAREEAALAEKKAAQQAEAKKQLEQLFLKDDGDHPFKEIRESELIAMAKRAGIKVLKAASAGPKEKVRLVKMGQIEEMRELLAEGWTIGRPLDHLYFEMLAPVLAEKPRARAKQRGK